MTLVSDALRAALVGIHGIHITPYADDGTVDEAGIEVVVRRIASAGIHAVVTGGNTGEFFSLTMHEIVSCQQAAMKAGVPAAMIAGVGRSLAEAIELTKSAERLGYDAVMVHQPADPFAAPGGTMAYIRGIAAATALPLLLYVRTEAIGAETIAELAKIDQVVGVKFARPNVIELSRCIDRAGKNLAWICGLAEQWAPAFYAMGARGFTSGLVNIAPKQSLAIYDALEAGQMTAARGLVAEIADFEELRSLDQGGANVTVIKEALARMGQNVGRTRPPGSEHLAVDVSERLAAILRRWRQRDLIDHEVH